MNISEIRLLTHTRISKLCLNHFGYKPSHIDIVQKLAHISRIDNPAPCNMAALKEHIIKTMMKFIANNYPLEKRKVVNQIISRMKSNPSKQLPLP